MSENWETNWKDYYKILQLHPSAEQEVVKGAYDKLARKYHPDVNKNPIANERMKDINEAFEILSDLEKRRRYHSTWLQKSDVKRTNPQPSPSATPKADYKETVSNQPSGKSKRSTSYMDSKLVVTIWILLLLIGFLIWLNTR